MHGTIDWTAILAGMFQDPRFRSWGRWKWFAEIEGKKIGIVIATKNQMFDTFALNKSDFDRLVEGKHQGKIDHAFIVWAEVNANGLTFFDSQDAEELARTTLACTPPRVGRYGEFWSLEPSSSKMPF